MENGVFVPGEEGGGGGRGGEAIFSIRVSLRLSCDGAGDVTADFDCG